MLIGGICSSTEIWGGVRRYFEIGNCLVDDGHDYHFICMHKTRRPWVDFKGKIVSIRDINKYNYDILFTGTWESFPVFLQAKANKKVVIVVSNFYTDKYVELFKSGAQDYLWIGVSHNWQSQFMGSGITGYTCPGGVNTNFFSPNYNLRKENPIRISFYGQKYDKSDRAREALDYVELERQLLKVYAEVGDEIEIVAFDSKALDYEHPIRVKVNNNQNDLRELLQSSHLVVSGKRKGCWDNVVAESFACGVPAVSYYDGTVDFLEDGINGKVVVEADDVSKNIGWFLDNKDRLLACGINARKKIEEFSWEIYTKNFMRIIEESC